MLGRTSLGLPQAELARTFFSAGHALITVFGLMWFVKTPQSVVMFAAGGFKRRLAETG